MTENKAKEWEETIKYIAKTFKEYEKQIQELKKENERLSTRRFKAIRVSVEAEQKRIIKIIDNCLSSNVFSEITIKNELISKIKKKLK